MPEKQIIKQLKELQQVKPSKDWALLTREKILNEGIECPKVKFGDVLDWFLTPIRRPALVLRTTMVAVLLLAGVLIYYYYYLTPLNYQLPVAGIIPHYDEGQEVVASLESLQESLSRVSLSLNNLKNVENPSEALVMTEVVRATANEGERVADKIKNSEKSLSKQVLLSVDRLESASKDLGEANHALQKEIFEDYVDDLKQRSLSEEDQLRLEKAESYYQEGREEEAMILIMRIGA